VQKILSRFTNPYLPDTVNRVGRAPLRKLGRHERFIGPAAELAERGVTPVALLDAISAALRFDDGADDEAVELARMLSEMDAAEAVERITELPPSHPLFPQVLKLVEARKAEA
jgi:mannitol-1-phosphate 5-dehydrogenase